MLVLLCHQFGQPCTFFYSYPSRDGPVLSIAGGQRVAAGISAYGTRFDYWLAIHARRRRSPWDPDFGNNPHRPDSQLTAHVSDVEVLTSRKLCEDGQLTEAFDALNLLVQRGSRIPNDLFYRLLKRCIAHKDLALGRRIHALIVKNGYLGNAFLATHLIGLYSSHGKLEEAMEVFSTVTTVSAQNWASIIFAYARHGQSTQAIELYRRQMRESTVRPDNRIFVAVLKACASARNLAAGKDVHGHIRASAEKPDMFVRNSLVDMYAKCGSLKDARRVFEKLPRKDVVTWTAMIAGYAKQGMGQEALELYTSMQQETSTPPNSVTFVCLLQACAGVGGPALQMGKQLHAQIEERGLQDNVILGGSLVNMYAQCGSFEDAQRIFDKLHHKNVVTWNAMIAGYAQKQMGQKALSLYTRMQQEGINSPDSATFVCLLQACAGLGALGLHQGTQVHEQIAKRGLQGDVLVGASLVNMYAKCCSLEDARIVFDSLLHKDLVTWTTMIAGYAQQGMGQDALSLYSTMQQQGTTRPDSVTYACLLQACASAAALPLGKQLRAQIEECGLQADVIVGSSLVNMYAKCGNLQDAQQVFDSLPEKDVVAWSALVAGYSRQGHSEVVFNLLDRMRLEGLQPDGIIFRSVLTVCSHAGLVDKGREFFRAMSTDYGIHPTVEHYTCMVDLLGRAGHLDQALWIAETMPFQPNLTVWLTLLGACQKWCNVEVGRHAFELAVSLNGKDASSYVLMSNIYCGAQMWKEAEEMEARRVNSRAWKQPGQSWYTDIGGFLHTFVAGDRLHV